MPRENHDDSSLLRCRHPPLIPMKSILQRPIYATLAFYWMPALVWAVAISAVSHIPAQEIQKAAEVVGPMPIAMDIAYHVIVFGVMGALGYWAASRHLGQRSKWSYLVGLGFAIGYGAFDEVHQTFVTGRSSAAEDVGYDALGATVAIVAIFAVRFVSARSETRST